MSFNLNAMVVSLVCLLGCARDSTAPGQHDWVSISEHGDKPGTALVLSEEHGHVTLAKLYILDPNNPRNLSVGIPYELANLVQNGNTITGLVTVADRSSGGAIKTFQLTITLEHSLSGSSVKGKIREDNSGEQSIVLSPR